MANASSWIKRVLLTLLALLVGLVALVIVALLYLGIPQNAAGMAAKGVCSAAFVAGRPWQKMLADDVLPASPVLGLISIAVDENAHAVTARFAGLFARRAALLPQRGCVLDLAPAGEAAPTAKRVNPDLDKPWPQGEAALPVAQWGPGVDAQALQKVLDQAFVGAGDPAAANARGVAIVHQGRLLALRNGPGFAAGTPLHGWSMSKTVNGMLLHKLAAETQLSLDSPVVDAFRPAREPAWVASWRQDERKNIKVSDLLYMRDGLASTEDYDPWGSVPKMLWGQPSVTAFAAASPTQAAPGTRWRYLSATANLLAGVARGRFSNDADYWAYPAKALFEPIGASSAVLETDSDGNWVGSSYVWASAGDWARLGQLMLNDGRWGDTQVLPPGWLKRASTPSTAQGEGLGYGAQSWLIGNPAAGECKANPGVPADTVAMMGHWGQIVAVVPSREAVIVRLGWTFKRAQFDACAFVADVLRTLPK
ncbi:MAG: serine hydrolase [Rhodoferax sp.]|uniref:serine hydrolase domain-containing protein n=1 Tax=Rhodoferax sp. TaxID=50421 RepID=UPI0026144261|nr:serine hydrolase [Rhodoferax sp.]MDD5333748.1 serine hydrolase [Rhodoferax sp.]